MREKKKSRHEINFRMEIKLLFNESKPQNFRQTVHLSRNRHEREIFSWMCVCLFVATPLFGGGNNCANQKIYTLWHILIYLIITTSDGTIYYMYSYKTLVFSYSLLVSMLSHSSVFTSPLGRSPPFWASFPDMVAAVTIACSIANE